MQDVPSSTSQPPSPSQGPARPGHDRPNLMGGVILVILGLIFLAVNFIPNVDFGDLWPLILIGIGGVLLWNARTRTPK